MANLERITPNNKEAEICVLGAIMLDSDSIYSVSEIITADDFYYPEHKEIYKAMLTLEGNSQPIDIITVCDTLQKAHSLESVGGRSYIAEITNLVPTSANAAEYAKVVAEKALYRNMISVCADIANNSYKQELDAKVLLDKAEQEIFNLSKDSQNKSFVDIQDVVLSSLSEIRETQEKGEPKHGVLSGYKDLDKITNGFQKSNLIILAARPSVGKTAFALNIAQNVAVKNNGSVAIFSLEMSTQELGLRLLAMEARVNSSKLLSGKLDNDSMENIQLAAHSLRMSSIYIDDTSNADIMQIRNKCRKLARTKHLDLIIIDYLQLMQAEGFKEGRQLEVAYISRGLKQLAREMDCPVIVLSQMSRDSEKRSGNHRPMLSDLRDSGAIEQDADVVMFLHRDDYYREPAEYDNICEVIVAKQRNGSTGSAKLTWMPAYTKFVNLLKEK